MKLRVVALVVGLVGMLCAYDVRPASAEVGAGPWDVQIAWGQYNDGSGVGVYIHGRVSTDTDDDASNYYRLCWSITRHNPNFGPSTGSGSLLGVPEGEVAYGPNSVFPGTGSSTYTFHSAWVVRNLPDENATCTSGTPLPIRGRGNVTSVPTEFIEYQGATSTPAADEPMASGEFDYLEDGYASGMECGRTLQEDGTVDLFARRLEPLPTNATVVTQGWTATWDDDGGIGEPTEGDPNHALLDVEYPGPGDMPPWGWVATFHLLVELDVGHAGRAIQGLTTDDGGGEWVDSASYNDAPWWSPVRAAEEAAHGIQEGWEDFADGVYHSWQVLVGDQPPGPPEYTTSSPDIPTPSGVRYFGADGTPVGGGDFDDLGGAPLFRRYELLCSVVVDPERPDLESFGPVQPPRPDGVGPTPPPTDGGGSGCNAGPLGKVPVLGGLFDGFARVVCGLADVLGRLLDGILDGLKFLFIPDGLDMGDYEISCDDTFPCSWLGSMFDAMSGLLARMETGLAGGVCGPEIKFDYEGNDVGGQLPAPSSSGCPGTGEAGARTLGDDSAGDLFGYRTTIRTVALVLLYAVFLRRMLSYLPWGRGDDVPLPT